MKRIVLFFLLISNFLFATSGSWEKNNFKNKDFTLPYQLFTPDLIEEDIPLVIYLHGSGEAGTDNEKQLYSGTNIGPQYFSSDEIQGIQKAYVLAPQTPEDIRWASTSIAEYDFETTPMTPSMEALLSLIDILKADLKVDQNRIYIAGLSRGGQGTWNAALNRPELFAAIVPIAGSASPKDAYLIKDIPTWIFHGDSDTTTSIAVSEHMFDELVKLHSNNLKFTVIKGGEHDSSWLEAHRTPRLWQWMILQNKK